MPQRYWLFKSEPSAYSYDDLARDKTAEWDGVRNYQARNYLRDEIKDGDEVLFYHSSTDPTAVVGVAKVVKAGHPDKTAWDPRSEHPDPKSTPENPIWYVVDIAPLERFRVPVTLDFMRTVPALEHVMLLKRGVRLSIQPVSPAEFRAIVDLGRGASSRRSPPDAGRPHRKRANPASPPTTAQRSSCRRPTRPLSRRSSWLVLAGDIV